MIKTCMLGDMIKTHIRTYFIYPFLDDSSVFLRMPFLHLGRSLPRDDVPVLHHDTPAEHDVKIALFSRYDVDAVASPGGGLHVGGWQAGEAWAQRREHPAAADPRQLIL